MKKVLLFTWLFLLISLINNTYSQDQSNMYYRGEMNGWGATSMSSLALPTSNYNWVVTIESDGDDSNSEFKIANTTDWLGINWSRGDVITLNSLTDFYQPNGVNGNFSESITKSYTFTIKDVASGNSEGYVFEFSSSPVSINSLTESNTFTVWPGQSTTITASLGAAKPTEQKVWLRYSTAIDFSTSDIVEMDFETGNDYTADIPASANTPGTKIYYYAFASGNMTATHSTADVATINFNKPTNNSYTVESSWTTSGSGDGSWNDPNSWDAGEVPALDQPVTIEDNLTLDQNASVSSITIDNGVTFTASDGSKANQTLTIADGGTLTNNGTFTPSDGTVEFAGAGTIDGSSTTPLNNLTLNGALTVTTVPTINGTVQLNSGASFSASPTYSSSSTLKYNTGGAYDQSNEWPADPNNPNSVTIVNTNLTLSANRKVGGGTFDVQSGGTINLDSNTLSIADPGTLTNNGAFNSNTGKVILAGYITLNGNNAITFNDLELQGGITVNTIPTVNGTLQLNPSGSLSQSPVYGSTSTLNYDTGDALDMGTEWPGSNGPHNVTIASSNLTLTDDRTVGGTLEIQNGGTITASDDAKGSEILTIADGGALTNNGTFTAGSGKVVFAGAGTVAGSVTFNDVEIQGGVDFGSSSSLDGTLTVNSGFGNTNSITYNSGSTLKYSTAYTINSGDILWFPNTASNGSAQKGVPWNVEIDGIEVQLNDNFPFYMNGSLLNNGTFRLGTASDPDFGDLYLRGDFTDNGTFNANSRSVNFNGTTLQTIDGSSNTTFAYLNVASGAEVEVDSEKKITTSDGLEINSSSSLTLKSDADGTASFITSGSVGGDLSVEKYLANDDEWHYISSPVDLSSTNFDAAFGDNDPTEFYEWDESHDDGGTIGWWLYLRDGDWGSQTFDQGKGYILSYNPAKASNTYTLTGVPYSSNPGINLTRTTGSTGLGWNLVGNPYPCDIAGNDLADATNYLIGQNTTALDDAFEAIYLWDETYGYRAINNASDTTLFIGSGRSFMVKAATNNATFNVNTNVRIHADTVPFKYKLDHPRFELMITNEADSKNMVSFVFSDGMTKGLDPSYDAGKYDGLPDIALYSFLAENNDEKYDIQALPPLDQGYSVPLGLRAGISGQYTFAVKELQNFEPGTPIVLEDKVTGIQTDMSINPEYSFTIDQSGSYDDRFVLYFKSAVGISSPAAIQKPLAKFINGELQVSNVAEGRVDVRVVDITGRVVAMQSFNNADAVNMPLNVQTGVYIVEVAAENGRFVNKIYVK